MAPMLVAGQHPVIGPFAIATGDPDAPDATGRVRSPADLPCWQAAAAKASHLVLYVLLIVMPLVGWSMLSAGGYPIVLYGPIYAAQR